MTRKDYIAIASELRATRAAYTGSPVDGQCCQETVLGTLETVEARLASLFKADNPRFDREHFLAVVRGQKDLNSRPSRR